MKYVASLSDHYRFVCKIDVFYKTVLHAQINLKSMG